MGLNKYNETSIYEHGRILKFTNLIISNSFQIFLEEKVSSLFQAVKADPQTELCRSIKSD